MKPAACRAEAAAEEDARVCRLRRHLVPGKPFDFIRKDSARTAFVKSPIRDFCKFLRFSRIGLRSGRMGIITDDGLDFELNFTVRRCILLWVCVSCSPAGKRRGSDKIRCRQWNSS